MMRPLRLAGTIAVLALLCACAPTRQPRGEVRESGFLRDYSILKPGEGDQAKLRYVTPAVNWARYQSVQVESVTLWSGPELSKLKPEEKQELVGHAYQALVTALGKSLTIANAPGPGTLRVRAAITEATQSAVFADTVATVIPQVRLVTTLTGLAANTAATVGEASGEVEVTNSQTGELLAAAVDRRVGQRSIQGLFSSWSDVEYAWDHWAEELRAHLVQQGAGHPPRK